MKALSLMQPWASALFIRRPDGKVLKSIETRSWKTNVTGRIAIHASKGFPPEYLLEKEHTRIASLQTNLASAKDRIEQIKRLEKPA